jgi:hypothetical protein
LNQLPGMPDAANVEAFRKQRLVRFDEKKREIVA